MAENTFSNIEELKYDETIEPKIYITTTRLNLREEPSFEASVIKIFEKGEEVKVYAEEGEWVATENGYCMKKFLK